MTFPLRLAVVVLAFAGWVGAPALLLAAEPTAGDLLKAAQAGPEAARIQALDKLATMGSGAAEAVPGLIQLLSDASPIVRAHAAHVLGHVGDAAKPAAAALTPLVKDADESVRRQAVQALAAIRPGPQVMIPLITRLLEDSDAGVQVRILRAVTEAGAAAVPSLVEALSNEQAAYWACIILREIGPEAKAAVPALTARLADARPEVRREAALALGAMADAAAPSAAAIAKLLDDPTSAEAATLALGQIGRIPAAAEPKVRANAKSSEKLLSTISLWALARVHPNDKALGREAAEQLVARLSDKDQFVRVGAARALAALKLGPEAMLPIIEQALASADAATVHHALDAVAALGAPAVPRLIESLKHEHLRAQVAYILGQIGPAAAPATDPLAKLLASKDARVFTEAAMALAKIGPAASGGAPALVAALKQPECPNAHVVIYALGKIGPAASAARPDLLAIVGGQDHSLAIVAAAALIQIDPRSPQTAERVVPALIAGLSDAIPETRQLAAETLAGLKSAARSALPALDKAAQDEDPSVREAAAEAARAIRGG